MQTRTSQARLADANKNLIQRTLLLMGELGKAMGPAIERVARTCYPPAIQCLGDKKKPVCFASLYKICKNGFELGGLLHSPPVTFNHFPLTRSHRNTTDCSVRHQNAQPNRMYLVICIG
jgi:hypothetical protein